MQSAQGSRFGCFDFGLTGEQEARARALHGEAIVIDLLFAGPGGYELFEREPYRGRAQQALRELDGLALIEAVSYAIPYESDFAGTSSSMRDEWDATGITGGLQGMYFNLAKTDEEQIVHTLCDRLPWLHLAHSVGEIREIKAKGEHFIVGNCQPAWGFPRDLSVIEKAHARGLRSLMLSYNYSNGVACGCTERIDHGITNFGVEVIRECNRLGIVVDTSHVSTRSTIDACAISKAPVTANHTCAKALSGHARGKSDDEIKAIADTGGVVGLCWVPYFYTRAAEKADVQLFLDHVDYISELVGPQFVAIGSDGPPCAPKAVYERFISPATLKELGFRPEDNVQPSLNFVGLDDYRDYVNITRGLVKRGYSNEQIKGILGENYLRVFGEVCG